MRSFYARGVALALMLTGVVGGVQAQDAGMPSLLPLPPLSTSYPVARTSATYSYGDPSPAQAPGMPIQAPGAPVQAPLSGDYMEAMKGGYDSCSATCGPGGCGAACCGCGHYIYANALIMTNYRNGGTVTSVDSITGDQRINFCNEEFNGFWHGGFEIGTGWCFGCNCSNAVELVYWGIYPGTMYRTEEDNLDSLIDFSSLDYDGANAQLNFDGATLHQVQCDFTFHTFEANVVGNSINGGPFGCGMVGCNPGCGSRWGAGWVAGFRYMNLGDRFLFTSDPTDNVIDGDADELNYAMRYNNNLVGFQVGGGISYYVSQRMSAYATAKFGVFNNHVTGIQQVYGSQGNATINNGPFINEEFVVRSSDDVLSCAGQFDLGGRWAVTDNWSVNAGYRVLALAGVATSDTNLKTANFHDVDGIASQDAFGSFMLHGVVLGATYAW